MPTKSQPLVSQSQKPSTYPEITLDGSGKILGRFAAQITKFLLGKDLPDYAPNKLAIRKIAVINAGKLVLSGAKARQRRFHHTGYPGGLKVTTLGKELTVRPEKLLKEVVRGMLPRNRLSRQALKLLEITK